MKILLLGIVFVGLCLMAGIMNHFLGNHDPAIASIFGLVWGAVVAGPVTFLVGVRIGAFD